MGKKQNLKTRVPTFQTMKRKKDNQKPIWEKRYEFQKIHNNN